MGDETVQPEQRVRLLHAAVVIDLPGGDWETRPVDYFGTVQSTSADFAKVDWDESGHGSVVPISRLEVVGDAD